MKGSRVNTPLLTILRAVHRSLDYTKLGIPVLL
nr:MAG TPA: hypothetical protein [Caudoviricetes sp.]DAX86644.1 MAG TPA: hypothetical protein [Caudoviricetes sp.]